MIHQSTPIYTIGTLGMLFAASISMVVGVNRHDWFWLATAGVMLLFVIAANTIREPKP